MGVTDCPTLGKQGGARRGRPLIAVALQLGAGSERGRRVLRTERARLRRAPHALAAIQGMTPPPRWWRPERSSPCHEAGTLWAGALRRVSERGGACGTTQHWGPRSAVLRTACHRRLGKVWVGISGGHACADRWSAPARRGPPKRYQKWRSRVARRAILLSS